jgi:hypothetical protein
MIPPASDHLAELGILQECIHARVRGNEALAVVAHERKQVFHLLRCQRSSRLQCASALVAQIKRPNVWLQEIR